MRIVIGTPMAWYLKSEWARWRLGWVSDLAQYANVPIVESEGSVVDRGWNHVIMKAKALKPDWFVMLESDVKCLLSAKDFYEYLRTCRYDAVMSPGRSIEGWMYTPNENKTAGARILQDYSFWQNVRQAGYPIYQDPRLKCLHMHAFGNLPSKEDGEAERVFEGWMGLAAVRGVVLQSLRKLFTMAKVDYYCAINDVRDGKGY
jgi:hypothetical protein